MAKPSRYQLTALPNFTTTDDALYEERESGSTHLPFRVELALCEAIRDGDEKALTQIIDTTLAEEIIMGHLSGNPLTQTKYWAVTVIATAIHYAVLGGLDESDAYNLSDRYIRHIDGMHDPDACIDYLCTKAKELVIAVSKAKSQVRVSPRIQKILHYIHIHLHEKLTVTDLADLVGLSPDYLSLLFHKEVGESLHAYILSRKLEAAAVMLSEGKTCKETGYTLAFSGQSHFVSTFTARYGITPGRYRREHMV